MAQFLNLINFLTLGEAILKGNFITKGIIYIYSLVTNSEIGLHPVSNTPCHPIVLPEQRQKHFVVDSVECGAQVEKDQVDTLPAVKGLQNVICYPDHCSFCAVITGVCRLEGLM